MSSKTLSSNFKQPPEKGPHQLLGIAQYGHLAILSYSFDQNTGFARRADYKKDIAALPEFTLIFASEDEAFFTDKYEPLMREVTHKGSYHIVAVENHMSVVGAVEIEALIRSTFK